MIDIEEEKNRKTRALLVAPPAKKGEDGTPYELKGLVTTLEMEIADIIVLARLEVTPAYGIGTGKASEIAQKAKEKEADCIIFDFDIDPTKQRNWEKLSGVPCFDRQEVILRIFDARARTKEANLQVELAKLQYSLPRLAHSYGDMARQRGGSYGSKGSGETQLELDRRQVEIKIDQVKRDLAKVVKERATQRKQRNRKAEPSCALVGYTNAGKSSLLNALTNANVLVENKLFATLDPTTRKLSVKNGKDILITDTVGFISNLPHNLVNAFKSTLEEAIHTDLLLLVIDASDENALMQYDTVIKVLNEIGAGENEKLILLNKMDKLSSDDILFTRLDEKFPNALKISAKNKDSLSSLIDVIIEKLAGEIRDYIVPMEEQGLISLVRQSGYIIEEEWREESIRLKARIGSIGNDAQKASMLLSKYKVESTNKEKEAR